jgi:hypothetical protein
MTANPALADLAFLVGTWSMELSAAAFLADPDTVVTTSATFDWIEDGAAIVMRQAGAATWIIGRDDSERNYQVLYADDRGVSRVYQMSLADQQWRLWRNTREFSQRFDAQVSPDHAVIDGRWEKSLDGGLTWEHDFNLRYVRPTSP